MRGLTFASPRWSPRCWRCSRRRAARRPPIRSGPIIADRAVRGRRADRHHRAHPRQHAVAVARPERHRRQPRRRRRQHRHGAWWRAPIRTATRCCSPRPRSRSIPALFNNLPYDPIKDFAPISELVNAPNVLFVRPDSGINSIADLVAKAKAEPNKFNYASPGVGTKSHLTGELLKLRAGINMVHVPYRGGGPATQARGGRHGPGRHRSRSRRSSR